MDNRIQYAVREGQLVFKPEGILTFYNVAPFATAIQDALKTTGANNVVIDCSELTLLDSSALGSLAHLAKQLRERQGKVKLVDEMGGVTQRLFSLRLDRIIMTFSTVEEALERDPEDQEE